MQETRSVKQFIKLEGNLCRTLEIGARVDHLSTPACGLQNKVAQVTVVETTRKGLLSVYTRYTGLAKLQCRSLGNCHKETCNLPFSTGQNPKNTEAAEVSGSDSTYSTMRNLLEAESSKNFTFQCASNSFHTCSLSLVFSTI